MLRYFFSYTTRMAYRVMRRTGQHISREDWLASGYKVYILNQWPWSLFIVKSNRRYFLTLAYGCSWSIHCLKLYCSTFAFPKDLGKCMATLYVGHG